EVGTSTSNIQRSIVFPFFGVDSSKTNVGSVRIFPVIVNLVSQSWEVLEDAFCGYSSPSKDFQN
ncbi:MAG TPA: hypothetical protein VHP35_00760, partial [Terriglobia bacterium]|nr:hypothetical protein [Terriglobia bacterium]